MLRPITSTLLHASLSHWTWLTKHKFKSKTTKTFKTLTAKALNQAWGPSEQGVRVTA